MAKILDSLKKPLLLALILGAAGALFSFGLGATGVT